MKKHRLLLWGLILICFSLSFPAAAESAADDLAARFGDEAQMEYQGASYALKNRLTTLLFAAYEHADSEYRLQLAMLLLVDDDLDRIVPMQLDPQTQLSAGEYEGLLLADLLNRAPAPDDTLLTPDEARAIFLLEGVNSLFPQPLIESHMVLNAQGLDILDGGTTAEPGADPQSALKARLKAILAQAEGQSSSAQMDMFDSLSAYLTTDVKTGALMKIAKKAERYEVLPTQFLPGSTETSADGVERCLINQEELIPFLIEYFYKDPIW